MGYYIEVPKNTRKAEQIIELYGAKEVSLPEARRAFEEEGKGVVCVLEGPFWDAAGFMYCQDELEEFAAVRDGRPKRWLVMDRKLAAELAGYREELNAIQ